MQGVAGLLGMQHSESCAIRHTSVLRLCSGAYRSFKPQTSLGYQKAAVCSTYGPICISFEVYMMHDTTSAQYQLEMLSQERNSLELLHKTIHA